MERHRYERLSAQDQSLLDIENATTHMHVASINIFEAGPLRTRDGGINVDLYKRAVQSKLHRIPRFRQRLHWTPIESRAVWVDDPAFNLDYHIRHTALPRPGDDDQLKRLCGQILSQQLDRAHPLWEIWIVEGLQGNRFATVSKIHHCMLDGVAGVDVTQTLLWPKPVHEIPEGPPFVPHRPPSGWELFRDSLWRRASLPVKIVRGIRDYRRETKDLLQDVRLRADALADLVENVVQPAPELPFNGPLGPQRRFDWLEMELSQIKAIGKTCDCTVNDVIVAIVTGAAREFLISRRVHPAETEFRLGAPVNVRREEERGRLGNRVSGWILKLPISEADPSKRLELVKAITAELKTSQQVYAIEMMMTAAEWMPTAMLSLGMRVVSRASNTFVTNIPGPQQPLYLLGAKLLAFYPCAPLVGRGGLAIALISYNGKLFWGFYADYALMPDLQQFVAMIDASFKELAAISGVAVAGTRADTRSNGKHKQPRFLLIRSNPRGYPAAGRGLMRASRGASR